MGEKAEQEVKVVFDTNIWVSILLGKSLASELEPHVRNHSLKVFLSEEMVSELARVLTYPKITKILDKAQVGTATALASVLNSVELVETGVSIKEITRDLPDNVVLECAVSAGATYIVSGDPHLLDLKEFRGIKVMKAREFIDMIDNP